ncbi:hypothetical protein BD626DRAFT_501172, partial [Schizophyllum amplum]
MDVARANAGTPSRAGPTIYGKPLFDAIDFLQFPSEMPAHNQWAMDGGGEALQGILSDLPFGRPSNIERKCTYPCVLTNSLVQRGPKVKVSASSNCTADDGVYLRESDIQKLGLEFTGRTAATRQGHCKVYQGVRLYFPNDYNDGKTDYITLHVYELPQWVYKSVHSDHSSNSKKCGIIGVSLLAKHVPFPGNAGDVALAIGRCPPRSRFNAFDIPPCEESLMAMYCVQEDRPKRALYCSLACQRIDWKRPWAITGHESDQSSDVLMDHGPGTVATTVLITGKDDVKLIAPL